MAKMALTANLNGESDRGLLRVGVRLWDWSLWSRQIVHGVQRFAHERRNWRLYFDVDPSVRSQVNSTEWALDGILTAVLSEPSKWKQILSSGRTQIVGFTASVATSLSHLPQVRIDETRMAELICGHLVSGGFRRLAYCGGGDPTTRLDARHQAMMLAAEKLGYPYEVFREKDGIHMPYLVRWVARLGKPVGIVTFETHIARLVIQACIRAKVSVPDQVGVVSWDDDPMLAETIEPTISAAVLPSEKLGYEAARLLDSMFAGNRPTKPVLVEPSRILNIRESSDVSAVKDREVHLAQQFIQEHASESIKVPHVAKEMGISRKKLELDFARVTGHSPGYAIVRARLEIARRLLISTAISTREVAERSGIGTEPTLRRLFAEHEGMTPGQYRTKFGTI
jgi:LacI family transcriptional regulator